MIGTDEGPRTTTILTIDLPPELGNRLRRAVSRGPHRSLSKIALDALEAWVERDEEQTRGDHG